MKVLIDSNILLTGLTFKGPENKLIWLAILGKIKLVVSDYILLEFRKNIEQKFSAKRREKALALLKRLTASHALEIKEKGEYFPHLKEAEKLINKKDAPILACAMLPDIILLVTGDGDFHTKKIKSKLKVMKTQDFLEKFI